MRERMNDTGGLFTPPAKMKRKFTLDDDFEMNSESPKSGPKRKKDKLGSARKHDIRSINSDGMSEIGYNLQK